MCGAYSSSLRILTNFANTPDPAVVLKADRRRVSAEYELLILLQLSMCCIMLAIMRIETSYRPLTLARIARVWWPLAASWMLMGAELPALSAVIARLPNPEINLAAYGGVVFPLALIIESPIIMLLAASTALCKDWASYRMLYRFMMITSEAPTGLHVLVAFTPLYYVVVRGILGVPEVIVEPARIGLMIMTPWTWAIAYRRFQQGVLIRSATRVGGCGHGLRLTTDLTVLAIGYTIGTIQGIVVATTAVAAGVVVEAIYAGWAVRPVLRDQLSVAPPVEPPLTYRAFFAFYLPLVLTSLLVLLALPIGSAALSRMPQPVNSLAVWPVVTGLVFMVRGGSGLPSMRWWLPCWTSPVPAPTWNASRGCWLRATTLILLLVVATPLSAFWFGRVSALSPALTGLAVAGLWIALPMPVLSTIQSWFQGSLLHSRRTPRHH